MSVSFSLVEGRAPVACSSCVLASREVAALYLAWEYGYNIAVRIMRQAIQHARSRRRGFVVIPTPGVHRDRVAHVLAVANFQRARLGRPGVVGDACLPAAADLR